MFILPHKYYHISLQGNYLDSSLDISLTAEYSLITHITLKLREEFILFNNRAHLLIIQFVLTQLDLVCTV